MKRTELERIEREVRRVEKRSEFLQRRQGSQGAQSVGDYIEKLYGLFRYDEEEIFNTQEDLAILEVLEEMQLSLPQKKWDDVLRKAIKKAGVRHKDKALTELKSLLSSPA